MTYWSRTFPGYSRRVRDVRRFVTDVLTDCPVAEDAELIVSELATNAIQHSRSGQLGGAFHVRVIRCAQTCRVEVIDQGTTGLPHADHDQADTDEHGRGLFIVAALSNRWGSRTTPGRHTVWYELDWKPQNDSASS
jgi:anti-sigma regulatory factor (Ser/Thr protein kinase)